MRSILLVDMNSFYASVHQALDPSLRDKPVIVGGDPHKRHGIVLAASYEAKKFGVKTAMPNWQARRLAPEAVFIKPDHEKYAEFSHRIMTILRDFSPLVEPASIDEAYIDVTGCGIFGDSLQIAQKIKKTIKDDVGVLCSVGIGPNKLIAKMAAELQKSDGLTLLDAQDVPKRLWPLQVRKLFGVGASTEIKLNSIGIKTIGQLAQYPLELLEQRFGKMGRVLHMSANGIDESPVDPNAYEDVKSVGKQITLSRDSLSPELNSVLLDLAEKVGYRVRQGGHLFKTITLILKDTNFISHNWSSTLSDYTDITELIYSTALELLRKNWSPNSSIRLIGLSVTNLIKEECHQAVLFSEKERLQKINKACDQIKNRYGFDSIFRAGILAEAPEASGKK